MGMREGQLVEACQRATASGSAREGDSSIELYVLRKACILLPSRT